MVTFLEISLFVAGLRLGEVYKVVSNICVKIFLFLFLPAFEVGLDDCVLGRRRRLKLFV